MAIFPDARTKDRNLNNEQVNTLIDTFSGKQSIRLISNNNYIINKNKYIICEPIISIERSIQIALSSMYVICADSFMGHLSGLLGIDTVIIYNNPKFLQYCEYWGPPYKNVLHIENESICEINRHFHAFNKQNIDLAGSDIKMLFN